MTEITYQNDVTGSVQKARGSDGRLNVNASSDARAYYNSRDKGQCYSIPYTHLLSANGEHSFYIKNNSTSLDFIVTNLEVHSDLGARCILWFVTGTAANGVAVTPTNMNRNSNNDADASALEDGGGTAISGITNDSIIDRMIVAPNGHEQLYIEDRIRLGQGDAIALEVDEVLSGTPDIIGTVFGYFE